MNKQITFTCPDCGAMNKKMVLVPNFYSHEVVFCDIEQGGCDKILVLKIETNVTVSVGTIKF